MATGRSIPTRFHELTWTAPCADRRVAVPDLPLRHQRAQGGYVTVASDEHGRPVLLEIRMANEQEAPFPDQTARTRGASKQPALRWSRRKPVPA